MTKFNITNSKIEQMNVHGDNVKVDERAPAKPQRSPSGMIGTAVTVAAALLGWYVAHLQFPAKVWFLGVN